MFGTCRDATESDILHDYVYKQRESLLIAVETVEIVSYYEANRSSYPEELMHNFAFIHNLDEEHLRSVVRRRYPSWSHSEQNTIHLQSTASFST